MSVCNGPIVRLSKQCITQGAFNFFDGDVVVCSLIAMAPLFRQGQKHLMALIADCGSFLPNGAGRAHERLSDCVEIDRSAQRIGMMLGDDADRAKRLCRGKGDAEHQAGRLTGFG